MEVIVRAMLTPSERPGDLGRLGRYRVLRVLGRGGMGVVFEAEDEALKRRVALKAILPTIAADAAARQRCVREAVAAAKVGHDNIAPIYDISEANGVPFLAMPLLIGETLDARLKARESLTAPEALAIGRQVAEGLAAAHAAGLIHRDIKPANIWLERTPAGAFKRARILDFGLARSIGDAGLTHSGAIMGTPAYMAPEQARGQKVDHRADLFSLGCVLYQMATGRRPFRGDSALAVLSALANDTPPAPQEVNPTVPTALSALIELLLSKDPSHRWPATAQEVADELLRIANDPPGTSGTRPGLIANPVVVAQPEEIWAGATAVETAENFEDDPPAAHEPARRRRGLLFAVCVVLLGAAAAAGVIVRIETDKGELVIEVDDPDIEVKVVRGDAVLVDRTKGREFVLKAGEGEVLFFDPQTGAEVATKKFAIKRGDKEMVRATLAEVAQARPKPKGKDAPKLPQASEPPKPAPLTAKQREAVEWVLSVGGKVEVLERAGRWLSDAKQLPAGPLTLGQVDLLGVRALDDASIDRLRELPPIGYLLSLRKTAITDFGLAKLVTFPCLANTPVIALGGTAITRASLAHLKKLPRLNSLDLEACAWVDRAPLAQLLADFRLQHISLKNCKALGDAEMDLFAGNKDVLTLNLGGTEVTDVGIKKLEKLTQLENFGAESEGVTDAVLDTVVKFRELRELSLGLGVTNAGLAKIASLPKLSVLWLDGNARVTDAGLVHLAECKSLMFLSFQGAGITKAGIEALAAALPNCRIEYDGGVIEPKK